jgi:Tfp pilus assembly protein PilF
VKRPKAWAAPRSGLGKAYLQQVRWDAAEQEYNKALVIDPAYARCGLGNLEARRRRYRQAFARAWNGLGEVDPGARRGPS